MVDPDENSMVSGYGWRDPEDIERREARLEAEWEHADDEWNDCDWEDFEWEELG